MSDGPSSTRNPGHERPAPSAVTRGTTRDRINVRDLHATLTAALRHGARTARIAHYTPHLIEILYPDGSLTAAYLAAAEDTIRAAVESIGGTDGQALATLLGLAPGTLGMTLTDRRAVAARMLGMEPDTMRRNHQRSLMWDLAMEIYCAHPAGPEADDHQR